MAKFLVIRFSSIGDIVLTTPVLRHLKKQVYGGAEIHYLTKKRFANILEANPYVDKVYSIERSTHEVREAIKNEGYDYLIDLHSNIRSRMIKRTSKVIDFSLRKYNKEKWMWVNFGLNKMPNNHIVDRYMETVLRFDIEMDDEGLDYFIPEKDQFEIGNRFEIPFIVWAIGAAHIGKRFSYEKLNELLPLVDKQIVLIGGKEDQVLGEKLATEHKHVYNLSGDLTLHQSASIINQSEMVISPDTGMMHIAAALKKKTISYWGCTHPGLGMYPYMSKELYRIVMPEGGRTKPCSKLGNKCKVDRKNPCLNHIRNQDMLDAIDSLWNA